MVWIEHTAGSIVMRAAAGFLATVLALAGVPIPDDVDGTVLREILRPGRTLRPMWSEAQAWTGEARTLDAATNRAIEERLRGLGYLQ